MKNLWGSKYLGGQVIVILGKKYTSYRADLKTLSLENLNERRERLCLSFAKKISKMKKEKIIPKEYNQTEHGKNKKIKNSSLG